MLYLQDIASIYEQLPFNKPHGCTEEEVRLLEHNFRCVLPASYREFLVWMGHGTGDFLVGSKCFFANLVPLQKSAARLLKDNNFTSELPKDAFVFWMHQGYQFLFFCLSEGDDPPVHYYNENDHHTEFGWNTYPHFSEFLEREIIGHAQLEEEIAGRPNGIRELFPEDIPIHPRIYDAELKLVLQMVDQLGVEAGKAYPERTGKARIVSEQPPCIYCQWAIAKFNRIFPNLIVEIAVA